MQDHRAEGEPIKSPEHPPADVEEAARRIVELTEKLKFATPGPYGFQAYGRRERLVTVAAGNGSGEPIAIFNRVEDAKAVEACLRLVPALLSELSRRERMEKALKALKFGTSDLADELVGWRHYKPSSADVYRCEFCNHEHEDCALIEHAPECPVTLARASLESPQ